MILLYLTSYKSDPSILSRCWDSPAQRYMLTIDKNVQAVWGPFAAGNVPTVERDLPIELLIFDRREKC